MGKTASRFVAKAESRTGWRIWDKKAKKWWGEHYQNYPEQILAELNGNKRPEQIQKLIRQTPRKRL